MFWSRGYEMRQTKRGFVVAVLRNKRMVQLVVLDTDALPFRIVVNVGDGIQIRSRGIQQHRGLDILLQPDVYSFEQGSFVVGGPNDIELSAGLIAVRGYDLDRPIQRIVTNAT